jgi:hypothetical protein
MKRTYFLFRRYCIRVLDARLWNSRDVAIHHIANEWEIRTVVEEMDGVFVKSDTKVSVRPMATEGEGRASLFPR